jgi:hypothetical protein
MEPVVVAGDVGSGDLAAVANSLLHLQPRGVLRVGPCRGEGAVVPDGASCGDVGYGDLANSLLQSRGVLRGGPCRGRVLLYLMEPVVEMWDMETWLTAFSSPGAGSGEGGAGAGVAVA